VIRPLLLTLATGAVLYLTAPNPLRVIDGDTAAIGPDRYRLATTDAPELFHPRCARELELASKAKTRLIELTQGDYSLTHVPCTIRPAGERNRDRYGRTCVILKIPPDWTDVGDTLIAEGLAVRFEKGKKTDWCKK